MKIQSLHSTVSDWYVLRVWPRASSLPTALASRSLTRQVYFPSDGHSEDAESNAAGSQAAGVDVPVRVFEGIYLGTMSTAGDYAS